MPAIISFCNAVETMKNITVRENSLLYKQCKYFNDLYGQMTAVISTDGESACHTSSRTRQRCSAFALAAC